MVIFGNRLSGCVSDHTRGVAGGAYSDYTPGYIGLFESFTIASSGVAVYFGEATMKTGARASTQNMVRGLFGGGSISPTQTNAIDMITIQTSGNATDFGDLSRGAHSLCGMCDSHGGLGGY